MSALVHLDAYRTARAGDRAAECDCGSQWFVLKGRTTDPAVASNGAVTLDVDGRVTGYAGTPHCGDCGRAWTPRAVR